MRATHAPPTLAVTALVTATAAAAHVGARTAVLAAAVLVGQMSIGWANDCLDAERDRAVGRRDKPVVTGAVDARLLAWCAGAALVADVPLSLAVGWRPGAAHLVGVGSAWLYDLRLKETVASWTPYALSFGLLPVIIATAKPHHPNPQPLVVAVAGCLGVAAHFANTVGDAADDARTGVRGLPQRLGPRTSTVIASLVVVVAAVLLVIATRAAAASIVAAAVAAVAVPVAAGARARQATFLAVIAAAGVLVVAFVVAGAGHLTRR